MITKYLKNSDVEMSCICNLLLHIGGTALKNSYSGRLSSNLIQIG